jgi:hypothetical protein
MKRFAILALVAMALALAPAALNAQGLFSGLPGLPSFGGYLGGSSGCGEKLSPSSNLEFYVGWMEDREGTTISADTTGINVAGVASVRHNFTNRGLWLGLSDTVWLSDNLSFIASGWYLVPSNNSTSREQYNGNVAQRTWETDSRWWYVDGLLAFGSPSGLNLLAGLRYDYYTVRFKDPFNVAGVLNAFTDTADATSEGWIPLFGAQYAQSSSAGSLVVRAVGVPTLIGNLKYNQTFGAFARAETKGNYNNGWFLEFFAEYSKSFGPGSVGVFGRWNGTKGYVNADFTAAPFAGTDTFRLTVQRNAWTVGGSFSLNFTLPYM